MQRFALPALVLLVAACAGDDPDPVDPTPDPSVATTVELISGDDQSGRAGDALAEPIVVRVLDQYGDPLAGQQVVFTVTQGDGDFATGTAVTDAAGLAQDVWQLGPFAGEEQRAYAGILDFESGEHLIVEVEASARPGALAQFLVTTDVQLAVGDTAIVDVIGFDAHGNTVPADSFEITSWGVSDSSIATIENGRVIGLEEGVVLIVVTSGGVVGQTELHVEATVATRFGLWGRPASGDGRLLLSTGDSLYEWTGSAWVGSPFSGPDLTTWQVYIAPVTGELWRLEGGTVYRSTNGTSWTESLELDLTFTYRASLDFMPDGSPIVVADTSASLDNPLGPLVLRLEGDSWVALDMPHVVGGDFFVVSAIDIAAARNGDIYVGGFAGRHPDPGLEGRPFLARYSAGVWTFVDVGTTAAWIGEIETSSDGVIAVRQPVNNLYGWDLLGVVGSSVSAIPTPADVGPYKFEGLAVSPTGAIGFTFYDATEALAGAAFQTEAGWDHWMDTAITTSPMEPVWHDGDLWFPMTEGFVDEQYFVVRLQP